MADKRKRGQSPFPQTKKEGHSPQFTIVQILMHKGHCHGAFTDSEATRLHRTGTTSPAAKTLAWLFPENVGGASRSKRENSSRQSRFNLATFIGLNSVWQLFRVRHSTNQGEDRRGLNHPAFRPSGCSGFR